MTPKIYRVSYYAWSYDKYGDKDFKYCSGWVDESALDELNADSWVSDLEVHEEKEVE